MAVAADRDLLVQRSQADVMARLLRAKWILLAAFVLAAAVAYVGASFMRRAYLAETVLIPAQSAQQQGLLGSLAGGVAGTLLGGLALSQNVDRNEAIATLKSRGLIRQFVIEKGLATRFCSLEMIECDPADSSAEQRETTLINAVELFRKRILGVNEDKQTGLIRVSVTWIDRNEAANWANQLVQLVNRETAKRAAEAADVRATYLRQAADGAGTVELRASIYRLLEAQINAKMEATTRPDYAFRIIDRATAPSVDRPVRPRKALMALAAGILGTLLAAGALLYLGYPRANTAARQD